VQRCNLSPRRGCPVYINRTSCPVVPSWSSSDSTPSKKHDLLPTVVRWWCPETLVQPSRNIIKLTLRAYEYPWPLSLPDNCDSIHCQARFRALLGQGYSIRLAGIRTPTCFMPSTRVRAVAAKRQRSPRMNHPRSAALGSGE